MAFALPAEGVLALAVVVLLDGAHMGVLHRGITRISFSRRYKTLFLLFPICARLVTAQGQTRGLTLLLLVEK